MEKKKANMLKGIIMTIVYNDQIKYFSADAAEISIDLKTVAGCEEIADEIIKCYTREIEDKNE